MATPLPPAAPTQSYWTGNRIFVAGLVLAVTFSLGSVCGFGTARSEVPSGTAAVAGPTTSAPPSTPTAAPTPVTLSGQGSKVLPVSLRAGRYKVTWSAQGHDNFIVHLLGDNTVSVVNEIPPEPSSGETVLSVRDTGSYQLQVEGSTLTWTITLTPL